MSGYAFAFAPDASEAASHWLGALKAVRRMSPRTLEAYARDIGQFATFLTVHLGGPASAADLSNLSVADFRAFLASRRNGGAASRSLARQLSAIRSFFRHAERNRQFRNPALAALRSPKLPHAVPKPLTIEAAARVTANAVLASDNTPPWVTARDQAVLTLLYGLSLIHI